MPSLRAIIMLALLTVLVPATAITQIRASTTERAQLEPKKCIVDSVASAADLSNCTRVEIDAFTVPSGETVTIAAAAGAVVTMTGDITFSQTNGKFKGSGIFEDVTILNSPAQAVSVGTTGPTTIRSVMVDDSAGNIGNLGHNTDGFDISASDLVLSNCVVNNQDDCIAINSGISIVVKEMTCIGSHGISIGSIATNKSVSDVRIARNNITVYMQVDAVAINASVSNVTYERNTVSRISEFGVLITQSYPNDDTTPGTGASISGISFLGGTTNVSVESDAFTLVVDCGACSGIWDFAKLNATGGKGSIIAPDDAVIVGGVY
ncbi:pectin lyase fold/virulence factor [Mycena epipterygia]|nr:pectin lyase fold/virulence factor [Mycena epipterygia]